MRAQGGDRTYLHLRSGHGGIYKRPIDGVSMTYIGTAGCRNDVFVCIPIDSTRCFAARIGADYYTSNQRQPWMVITPVGRKLQDLIHVKLAKMITKARNALKFTWPLDPLARTTILCPTHTQTRHDADERTASSFIIEAIRDFFLVDGFDEPTVLSHGCVVNPWSIQKRVVLGRRDLSRGSSMGENNAALTRLRTILVEETPEMFDFRRVDEGMTKHWLFVFDSRRPESYFGWLVWGPCW